MVGAFLTFVLAIGDYITPQILGGNNELLMPQLIMMQIGRRGDFPLGLGAVDHPDGGGHRRLSRLRALAEDRAGLTMRALLQASSRSLYALAVYGFIFLPVVVLVLFSLQATSFPIPPFTGPSLRWYEAVLVRRAADGGARQFDAGRGDLLAGGDRARLPRRLGLCPLHACRRRRCCAG